MSHDLAAAFRHEMACARDLYQSGELARAFVHLERAHVLGQRYFGPHLATHWWMLKVAFRQRSIGDAIGQISRSIAVIPGFLFGWVPKGNTGGSNVSAIRPMPIAADLAGYVADHDVWRDVRRRVGFWIAAVGALLVALNVSAATAIPLL